MRSEKSARVPKPHRRDEECLADLQRRSYSMFSLSLAILRPASLTLGVIIVPSPPKILDRHSTIATARLGHKVVSRRQFRLVDAGTHLIRCFCIWYRAPTSTDSSVARPVRPKVTRTPKLTSRKALSGTRRLCSNT